MVKPYFEEKSYETAFNAELVRGQPGSPLKHFAPGARLEALLQFDVMAALSSRHPAWKVIGLASTAGMSVKHQAPPHLPSGVFNLFIQYKRSDAMIGTSAAHRAYFGGPYFRFRFDRPANQLPTLQTLSWASGVNAHVIYAAPEFHTIDELMDALITGTVIDRSVIVEAIKLIPGHSAFNFKTGHQPLQNPVPERVEARYGSEFFQNLEAPLVSVREAVASAQAAVAADDNWSSTWAQMQRRLLGDTPLDASPSDASLVSQFAEVMAFTWAHGISWFLTGHDEYESHVDAEQSA